MLSVSQHSRTQMQHSVLDGQIRVGWNHVGVVRLHHHSLCDLADGNLGGPRQDFLQRAAMFGVKVLHQHEGHAGLFWQVAQQFGERFEPARRRPDPHDGEQSGCLGIILCGGVAT